ncbi:helix-turn-helix domain-containing protein [Streptosporangium sp. NPDC006007]|uniref:helix-turn-helix transcriptional regulator n=1 Tax=Streptosporangium sp. NPDC006007 TaxID=3154575 RepID=UPI0033B10F55
MQETHLTVEDLAARLRVPPDTVYRWNSRGGGPAYIKVGRHARYRLADVIAWEDTRRVGQGGGR